MHSKIEYANQIIKNCIGKNGVYASTNRYKNQCWTRDFCLTVCPLLLAETPLKNVAIVKTHLLEIAKRQLPNGKVPILFLDDEIEFLREKVTKSIKTGEMSFMLKRYLDKDLENLTPHTRDGELLFILAVAQYFKKTSAEIMSSGDAKDNHTLFMASCKALKYIESILVNDLIPGADWRDTREDLNDKHVLTNACLLYKVYNEFEEKEKAERVKNILLTKYWNGTYFIDYPGAPTFDILGNSLAVLFDVADEKQRESIFTYTMELSTISGFKMCETFLPALSGEEKEVMDRDKAVVWPFINGFILRAMIERGDKKWQNVAVKEFAKWSKLDGFYEWYDIKNGNGFGSKEQIWSSAVYLTMYNNINKLNEKLF
ncbi:MAG: glycogen debranching enzyme alpha-1,6-glucosidase [Edafosvirus sp.]|uniref:Glycogen debranching enzyme alpha-1,6-glucosidase n=1 Tax=Edafosvirus sp. TaxID=2487765 RepID=A0A3G4ZXX9_9VIRU|nr:MAG: glycogen debranching enzyme alpha-1,6-glucosidase [Edafosvirus sp.]